MARRLTNYMVWAKGRPGETFIDAHSASDAAGYFAFRNEAFGEDVHTSTIGADGNWTRARTFVAKSVGVGAYEITEKRRAKEVA